jgi:transposase
VHVQAEGFGKPLAFVITEGQRHESRAFEELMKLGKLKRDSVGRPRLKPRCLAADKAYSSHRIRAWLRRKRIRAVIPQGNHEKKHRKDFDKTLYRERNRVERLIARLKQNRRIAATRYEKTAASYMTMLTLAAILLWL